MLHQQRVKNEVESTPAKRIPIRRPSRRYPVFFRFLITATAALAAILTLVGYGYHKVLDRSVISSAEHHASALARALRDLEAEVMLSEDDQSNIVIVPDVEALDQLDRRLRRFLHPLGIVKIKIYDSTSTIVYSTEAALIGEVNTNNSWLETAYAGTPISKLVRKDAMTDVAGETRFEVDVVETYVPIYALNDTQVVGAFEVYTDVTCEHAAGHVTLVRSIQVLGAVLLFVFGVMMALAWRADRVICGYTTSLERYSEEVVAQRQRAEAADQAKSRFLAQMSHEIRTPMTSILGFVDLSYELCGRNSPASKELLTNLGIVKRNGQYLLQLINDILDLSKIEAGKLDIEKADCSLASILSEVDSLIRVRSDAKGLSLVVRNDGPIPPTVNTDPTRLRQILVNLMGNAIKFTERGTVELIVRYQPDECGGPNLFFDIVDQGIGMTPEQQSRLFKPFSQAETSTTRKYGGTGLGLAISKQLAGMLGGDVSVTSAAGQGSTFTVSVTVPAVPAEPLCDSLNLLEATCERKNNCHADLTLPDGCRVLLAEDGKDNQRLIMTLLTRAGATVDLVDNGADAVIHALGRPLACPHDDGVYEAKPEGDSAHEPYDVVLMDMQMPILDGYGATQQLRKAGYARPIIALTAHVMSGDREKCLVAGCDDFVGKPIDRAHLIQTVSKYSQLSRARAEQAGASTPGIEREQRMGIRELHRKPPVESQND